MIIRYKTYVFNIPKILSKEEYQNTKKLISKTGYSPFEISIVKSYYNEFKIASLFSSFMVSLLMFYLSSLICVFGGKECK